MFFSFFSSNCGLSTWISCMWLIPAYRGAHVREEGMAVVIKHPHLLLYVWDVLTWISFLNWRLNHVVQRPHAHSQRTFRVPVAYYHVKYCTRENKRQLLHFSALVLVDEWSLWVLTLVLFSPDQILPTTLQGHRNKLTAADNMRICWVTEMWP